MKLWVGLAVFPAVSVTYFLVWWHRMRALNAVGEAAVVATAVEGVVLGLLSGLVVGSLFYLLRE